MKKEDLLNSVEMLLSADIIDAQTYTNLVRKVSLFNDSSLQDKTPKVSINKQAKEVCDHECSGVQNTGYLRECIKCGEYYKDKQTGCL